MAGTQQHRKAGGAGTAARPDSLPASGTAWLDGSTVGLCQRQWEKRITVRHISKLNNLSRNSSAAEHEGIKQQAPQHRERRQKQGAVRVPSCRAGPNPCAKC